MYIELNNIRKEIAPQATIQQLLESQGIDLRFVAVARNMKIVPRKEWDTTPLDEGDRITLIGATKGG